MDVHADVRIGRGDGRGAVRRLGQGGEGGSGQQEAEDRLVHVVLHERVGHVFMMTTECGDNLEVGPVTGRSGSRGRRSSGSPPRPAARHRACGAGS